MAGGWLGPLVMFWLYVWGPLRPFHYPAGDLFPSITLFLLLAASCVAAWWLPSAYYGIRRFERSGLVYEVLGVRQFRRFVPNGDLANRWQRRRDPDFRVIRDVRTALAFEGRTRESERGHLVLFLMGALSTAFAWRLGWTGWALYLGLGNVIVNLYPIMLQRYTRARLVRLATRANTPASTA